MSLSLSLSLPLSQVNSYLIHHFPFFAFCSPLCFSIESKVFLPPLLSSQNHKSPQQQQQQQLNTTVMKNSQTVETKTDEFMSTQSSQSESDMKPIQISATPSYMIIPPVIEEMTEPGEPHEAMFFVLAYLHLLELLTMTKVCKSLRDTINNDELLWRDIVVEEPLNFRVSDDILLKITLKAHGGLRTLALMNCWEITDDGLQRVIENNPHINKLYVPASTSLTPDGMVRIVKSLTEHRQELKCLKMNGLYGTKREHLEALYCCFNIDPVEQEKQKPNMFLAYRRFSPLRHDDTDHPIDIDICPKCNELRLVFECPRESCRTKERPLTSCRGCYFCIPRCEECGGCIDSEELVETVCSDVVCFYCWLKLPKCNMCNKPYCNRHADQGWNLPGITGFKCSKCISLWPEYFHHGELRP